MIIIQALSLAVRNSDLTELLSSGDGTVSQLKAGSFPRPVADAGYCLGAYLGMCTECPRVAWASS